MTELRPVLRDAKMRAVHKYEVVCSIDKQTACYTIKGVMHLSWTTIDPLKGS